MKYKALVCIVVLLALSCCNNYTVKQQEEENHTYQAAGYTRVEIETENGNITSTAAQGDSIDITLTKWATGYSEADAQAHIKDISVVITDNSTSGRLRVFVDIPEDVSRAYGCDITLSLPPGLSVDLVSSNGDIEAQGHEAGFLLFTSNGGLSIKDTKGSADLTTSNGGITVRDHAGDIDAITENGSISAEVVLPDTKGHCRLETSNGDVSAAIPSSVSADISLLTSNGSIIVDPELNITATKDENTVFEGTMGNPEDQGTVYCATSNGTVSLSRYEP